MKNFIIVYKILILLIIIKNPFLEKFYYLFYKNIKYLLDKSNLKKWFIIY